MCGKHGGKSYFGKKSVSIFLAPPDFKVTFKKYTKQKIANPKIKIIAIDEINTLVAKFFDIYDTTWI